MAPDSVGVSVAPRNGLSIWRRMLVYIVSLLCHCKPDDNVIEMRYFIKAGHGGSSLKPAHPPWHQHAHQPGVCSAASLESSGHSSSWQSCLMPCV